MYGGGLWANDSVNIVYILRGFGLAHVKKVPRRGSEHVGKS